MSHGVIPSGPVVAVHMFDVSSDKSDSSDSSQTAKGLRRWSREALDESNGFPPPSPHPPSTPRTSRPGSMRRQRSSSGQRPPSGKPQRPSSRSFTDVSLEQEDLLPPMATLRPQSSLGKYSVLPSISPTHDKLPVDTIITSRSDGSEDQRGMEEMEYLTSRMAHQALVETSRRSSRDSVNDRPRSRDNGDMKQRQEHYRSSVKHPDTEPTVGSITDRHGLQHHEPSPSSTISPELVNDRSHTSLSQYKMDEVPKPSVEGQVLLGIKIPTDGTRHKHYFNQRDQLRCIVLFAEEVSGEDFSNHVLVLATPRQCFDNLSQTIEAAGLESKSVLHLEELD
ncbi:uncharacterized protein LOC143287297 [Babylonia areolata]|uniref:uncharacterized protein LOC143287297 n=1 Tax=Babylonia areolata TaxID=304850 RepID=UPI003FCFED14